MHVRALVVVAVAHLARASIEAEAEEAAVYTCDESRVRKSWSLFSAKEKATYVSAVKALSDAGHYSTFVGLHLMLGDFIHATAMFFPFNRLFVWEFENALRATAKEYACVTVPLWDWAADNQAALASNALNATDATTPWAQTHAFLSDMGGASNWSAAAFADDAELHADSDTAPSANLAKKLNLNEQAVLSWRNMSMSSAGARSAASLGVGSVTSAEDASHEFFGSGTTAVDDAFAGDAVAVDQYQTAERDNRG